MSPGAPMRPRCAAVPPNAEMTGTSWHPAAPPRHRFVERRARGARAASRLRYLAMKTSGRLWSRGRVSARDDIGASSISPSLPGAHGATAEMHDMAEVRPRLIRQSRCAPTSAATAVSPSASTRPETSRTPPGPRPPRATARPCSASTCPAGPRHDHHSTQPASRPRTGRKAVNSGPCGARAEQDVGLAGADRPPVLSHVRRVLEEDVGMGFPTAPPMRTLYRHPGCSPHLRGERRGRVVAVKGRELVG